MPIDPRTGAPADPSQWWQTRALPRIVVHPKPPNGAHDNPPGADGVDDWFVPAQPSGGADGPNDWLVPAADGYPDDWFVPATAAASSTDQSALSPQGDLANPDISNRPASRSDPFAAYWSLIPASRVGAMAWEPPVFPDSAGRFPLPTPAPLSAPRIDPRRGLLGAPATPPGPNAVPSGLLGPLANPPTANPVTLASFQRTGFSSGDGGQSAPPSLFSSLANFPGSLPPTNTGGISDTDNYAVGGGKAGQFSLRDAVPFSVQPTNASPSLALPLQNSRPANPVAFPFLRPAALTSGDSNQFAPQSPLQEPSDLRQPPQSGGWGDIEANSESSPSAASQAGSDEPRSITRVVRDSSGRALAIVHVEPAQSSPPLPKSDATPNALRFGAKYAQINHAITGNPLIDRTTDMLLDVLQDSIIAMGSGSGPLFGVRVHTFFAKRVKQFDLPGIGQDGVEQSFHLNYTNFVNYGLDGSIRTDIVLRDPKNPSRGPIAVYDLKTGNAVLTPKRVEEIRRTLRQGDDLPVIMLHYRTGDAVNPPGRAPRQ